jgi:hypothetical protein
MKRTLWIAAVLFTLAGVGLRVVKTRVTAVRSPAAAEAATSAVDSAPPASRCPLYTLDDNGVCVPVPRTPSAATD